MSRRTPPDRVRNVASAACQVFIEKGYRRTLMSDVGAQLELSHALLYRYVESKEALFELAVLYAVDREAAAKIEVPVPTPPRGHTLGLLKKWGKENAGFPVLASALAQRQPKDITDELLGIIDERYLFMERNHQLLALIERSALDLPELHAFYFTKGRRSQVGQLASYLERRIRSGDLNPVSDVEVAARFIVETIAWFAMHRKGDLDSAMIADEQAHQTVRELLLAAFVAPTHAPREEN
jgi:AcrR family transcriptional regulator